MSVSVKIVVGLIVVIPLLYIGSCSAVSHQRERGFDQVKEGDTEQHVIQVMGQPTDRETPSYRLAKYGAPECAAPCVQRLWYSNKMSLIGEAWSVELDGAGKVVHTAHLTSP
ncbi:MAG: hypothetical protein ACTHNE_01290 [Dyella sp.]|uniref:hypothetical protein n=1 Tax=Dyella sp. TaxID=1869338 RepID=UPI003F7FF1FE